MRPITGVSPIIAALLRILVTVNVAHTERLLIITPAPSYSHQIVFRTLCLALNKRGHEIVVLTPNVLNDPSLINYSEIDFGFEYEKIADTDLSQTRWSPHAAGRIEDAAAEAGPSRAGQVLRERHGRALRRGDSRDDHDACDLHACAPI